MITSTKFQQQLRQSVLSYYIRQQRGTARIRPLHTDLLCAVLYRSISPAGRATVAQFAAMTRAATDRRADRQTDGQTPDRFTDPTACRPTMQ